MDCIKGAQNKNTFPFRNEKETLTGGRLVERKLNPLWNASALSDQVRLRVAVA